MKIFLHCSQNYMVYVTSAIAQNVKALDYCRMTLYGFTCKIDPYVSSPAILFLPNSNIFE